MSRYELHQANSELAIFKLVANRLASQGCFWKQALWFYVIRFLLEIYWLFVVNGDTNCWCCCIISMCCIKMRSIIMYFNVGMSFGRGTYFSTSSEYSVGYGSKLMILAKVVTGKYAAGNSYMDRKNLPSGCHSTVNNVSSPSIFVVYHDASAYPEYVIQYSRF